MQNPILATSLAEFWGRRWNTAFNELAFRFTFRPLRRMTTPVTATLLVFGLSGLIHELVISLPAGGGYGLPTIYFFIQGFGTVIERSAFWTRHWFGTRPARVAFYITRHSYSVILAFPSAVHHTRHPADAHGHRRNLKGNMNMNTPALTLLLELAGVMHLGLICAGALMPRAVNLRAHIAVLPPFIRRLFWVYYAFIGLCLISFGLITVTFAGTLAAGGGLARAVCAFLAVFWTVRLVAATFIFDMRPYLTNHFWRLGYHAMNVVFIYLPIIYAWAALKGEI